MAVVLKTAVLQKAWRDLLNEITLHKAIGRWLSLPLSLQFHESIPEPNSFVESVGGLILKPPR